MSTSQTSLDVNTAMLKEMAKQMAYLVSIMDSSPDIIIVTDLKKRILQFSKSGERSLGITKAEVAGKKITRLFKKDKRARELMNLIDESNKVDEFQVTCKTAKGHEIPFSVAVRAMHDEENRHMGYVINLHDIHRTVTLEKRLRRHVAELESLMNSSGAMIVTTNDEGDVMRINKAAEHILGVSNKKMRGRKMIEFYVDKSLRRHMLTKLKKSPRESIEYEAEIKTRNNEVRIFHVILSNFRSPKSGRLLGRVGISHDITERYRHQEELRRLLITDELTGLYNRRHFFELLQEKLKIMRRSKSSRKLFFLAFIDMDHFKEFNDTYGHQEGDNLLKVFGKICMSLDKEHKSIFSFRYGGDEFVLIIQTSSEAQALQYLKKLRRRFRKHAKKKVTLSMGLTRSRKSDNTKRIISRADKAVYLSKDQGKNTISCTPH